MPMASDIDFSTPACLAYKAVLGKIQDNPTKILQFGMATDVQQNKQSSAKD